MPRQQFQYSTYEAKHKNYFPDCYNFLCDMSCMTVRRALPVADEKYFFLFIFFSALLVVLQLCALRQHLRMCMMQCSMIALRQVLRVGKQLSVGNWLLSGMSCRSERCSEEISAETDPPPPPIAKIKNPLWPAPSRSKFFKIRNLSNIT